MTAGKRSILKQIWSQRHLYVRRPSLCRYNDAPPSIVTSAPVT
jgi:hypothetical protein